MGLSPRVEVRPGLTVVPMGWTSAVTLIQAAIRHISYEIARVPWLGDLPSTDTHTVLYLDNFDELRYPIRQPGFQETSGSSSAEHSKGPSKEERSWAGST